MRDTKTRDALARLERVVFRWWGVADSTTVADSATRVPRVLRDKSYRRRLGEKLLRRLGFSRRESRAWVRWIP